MSAHPFREAVERADLDAAVALLAEDVVFRSPAVFKPYEGRAAVTTILRTVFGVFEDFRYTDELDGDGVHGLLFDARVGDRALQGIDLLRPAPTGEIAEFTVMIRPASGLIALAERMRPALEAAGVGR
jgi:SnoaL-like domain